MFGFTLLGLLGIIWMIGGLLVAARFREFAAWFFGDKEVFGPSWSCFFLGDFLGFFLMGFYDFCHFWAFLSLFVFFFHFFLGFWLRQIQAFRQMYPKKHSKHQNHRNSLRHPIFKQTPFRPLSSFVQVQEIRLSAPQWPWPI